jgi:hypothetical protein
LEDFIADQVHFGSIRETCDHWQHWVSLLSFKQLGNISFCKWNQWMFCQN